MQKMGFGGVRRGEVRRRREGFCKMVRRGSGNRKYVAVIR